MASAFGHAALAGSLGVALPKVLRKPSVIILGIACSIFPDADVLGFRYGIRYEELWGHRGMTHSILFGVILGAILAFGFYHRYAIKEKLILAFYFIVSTVSHGILDGLTTGGMGVAYFAPFDEGRYFLPFRVIKVSPLSISRFFDEWGVKVLISEFYWIGIPSLIFAVIVIMFRKFK